MNIGVLLDLLSPALRRPETAAGTAFVLAAAAVGFLLTRTFRVEPRRPPVERRFYSRARCRFKALLDFNGCRIKACGFNFDRCGALVKLKLALRPGSKVFVYLKSERLMGWAIVRHCSRRGLLTYYVGMEFQSSLVRADPGDWQFYRIRQP